MVRRGWKNVACPMTGAASCDPGSPTANAEWPDRLTGTVATTTTRSVASDQPNVSRIEKSFGKNIRWHSKSGVRTGTKTHLLLRGTGRPDKCPGTVPPGSLPGVPGTAPLTHGFSGDRRPEKRLAVPPVWKAGRGSGNLAGRSPPGECRSGGVIVADPDVCTACATVKPCIVYPTNR